MTYQTVVLLILSIVALQADAQNPIYHGYGPENVTQYSGYITVNETTDGNLFYWLFESRNDPKNDPFVLWMTGGPGCSSLMALFEENGPYIIEEDLSLSIREYSWNRNATLLFVDQPVGTGLSYVDKFGDYVKTEEEVADDMYTFFQQFFKQFPQYSQLPFYIFGESYGGHYVPSVAARIVQGNGEPGNTHIPIQGVGIGDGWVDPVKQYPSFPVYGWEKGLITEEAYKLLNASAEACVALILAHKYDLAFIECESVMMGVVVNGAYVNHTGLVNWYDVREKCPWNLVLAGCYNFSLVTDFINQPSVRQALGVPSSVGPYSSCNDKYLVRMRVDDLTSFRGDIVTLLDNGLRVVSYNGMEDLICNYIGEESTYNTMNWSGKREFNNAPTTNWTSGGQVAGTVRAAQGLTFVTVNGAGHMVPMDQPQAAFTILENTLTNQPFS